jgi:pSer/pThr/pTyr-binding forkhead associated (FHA) protein
VQRPPSPSPPPAPTPPPEPPAASDAEKTLYETVNRPVTGKIVGVLVGVDGPFEGQLFGIYDGENTIGRGEQCRVSMSKNDRRISREHAKVIHRNGIFVVQPLKEKAVTKVNDEPTTGSELTHGDVLTLGDSTFRFVSVY